jgi:cellulose synthase/poly-beta-1,6-N-acetylglucosamine synthase-like glycosyltransferase
MFSVLVLILQIMLAIPIGYLLLLTWAAWRAERQPLPQPPDPLPRFLILIPAHNEERLLPGCLESLEKLDYPSSRFSIHVVADNCTDQTEAAARRGGAIVHVRKDDLQRGKGCALQWLYQQLIQAGEAHEAAVILDADTLVSPNFLRAMAAHLGRGERALQAYYAVRDPDRSWSSRLRYAAFAVLHYLRPQGRMVLGGSAGLKGNGMVFTAETLQKHSWSASVTEDIEFHMSLLLSGVRVVFVPEAVVWGEMPDTLRHARSQHARWEQGRLQMARRYIPLLLKCAWEAVQAGQVRRAFMLFDAVMEHAIPPFSVLAGASVLCLLAGLILLVIQQALPNPGAALWLARINLYLAVGLLSGQVIYSLSGLFLVRAPRKIYLALLYAPLLVVWKIGQVLRVLFGRNQSGWVRTTRNGG